MKRFMRIVGCALALNFFSGLLVPTIAGTAEEAQEGSGKIASEIKKDAVETGKAIVDTGKQVKEGASKGWSEFKKDAATAGAAVRDSVTEAGKNVKKTFHETKDAVTRQFSGNDPNKPEEANPEEKK